MDKSRGSSSEAVSGVKQRCDETLAAGADLEYEASLRSQLEAARADHEQMAHDHEVWAAVLDWLQQDESVRSLGDFSSLATGCGNGVGGAAGSATSLPRPPPPPRG
ncbi:hypothetical protein ZWY2020_058240 [Hordeum vulgare]|nr:hypothetical protein ZWY2020_058240 [Hordeum vulgare]